ncbi:hypothetical protein LCGC14_1218340 [marine sediment metagenome]|uniref:Beta-lactamase-related domain-containing protein n=1 Tax=marine sediment metagenome TaxID=412755 RepID=A0A0F9LC22_9ZZZZ|nr:class C beta-lactamase-related serine hydrolase [archaeon]HEC36830.1 class C beta-lactamase-related serine hydrolase [bacterium]
MKNNRKTIIVISIPVIIGITIIGFLLPIWIFNENTNADPYWETATPQDVDMRSDTLNGMINYLESENHDIYSVIIIRNGFIVEEWYASGYNFNSLFKLYSATKSITSTLIGIALDMGFISSVNQLMLDYFPNRTIHNLDANKESITIKHLLTMTAGFDWPEWEVSYFNINNIFNTWKVNDDYIQFVLDRTMNSTPGEKFNYNTGISHLLGAILEEVTNSSMEYFANEYLFEPLEITSTRWDYDPDGLPLGGEGLYLKARDMAKIGYLFLNKGIWGEDQIISKEWVNTSTYKHVTVSNSSDYGYQWWISKTYDSYRASGFGGQQIHVFPENDLVVVFTGWDLFTGLSWDLLDNFILPSIIV